MKITQIPTSIKDAGMPILWQGYAMVLICLSVIHIYFIQDPLIKLITDNLTVLLISIPLLSALIRYKKPIYPWGLFVIGAVFIVLSTVIGSLDYFGLTTARASTLLEELGIAAIALFSVCLLNSIEKNYKLNGLTIDFFLIILSAICLVFLATPNFLHVVLFELNNSQQLEVVHLFLGLTLTALLLVNLKLLKKIKVKDIILFLMVAFISIHFLLDILISRDVFENAALIKMHSALLYKLTGIMAVFHIFTETYDYNYNPQKLKTLGLQFLWSASILALLVTPMGVIYRWKFNLSPIEPYFVAFVGAILSLIVIWRISVLLRNYEKQRKTLKTIAFTDPLTGLPNYLGIRQLISDKKNMLVFTINIEDFKSINDMYERKFGDKVLISLAKRLKKLSEVLYIARTGSDNFLAVYQAPHDQVYEIFGKLQQELGVWDTVSDRRVAVPLTFGASHSKNPIKPEKLVRESELAFKESREHHKDFTLYEEKENTLPINYNLPRLELRGILQGAIDQNFLPIHFQPIYNLGDGSLKAVELLIRVHSTKHGLLLPAQFLNQAKSYGLLTGLTKVCINMVAEYFEKLPKVDININVPPYMLNNTDILNEFISCFHNANLPTERFCIEVTEDGEIETDQLIPAINLLKGNGFSISIDDFGTGYSSLGRLSTLPVDSVKIDRSLLLSASGGNKAILESAISLIKRLGVTSVVEGVETIEQLNLVRSLGADSVQGYLFSKPVKGVAATQFSLNASSIVAEF